jgi:hypothetical protein
MGVLLLHKWQEYWSHPPLLAQAVTATAEQPVEWHLFRRNRGPEGTWEEPVALGVMVSQLQRDEQNGALAIVHQLELDVGQLWHHWPTPESAGQLRLESRLDVGLFGEVQRLRIVGGWSAWSRWLVLLDVVPRPEEQASLRLMLNLPSGPWRQEYTIPWSVKSVPVNSLGPPDRLPGLRPGQRWVLPSLDPLNWSSVPGGLASAIVQPQTVSLDWQGKQVPCLAVHMQRPGLEIEWWVAQEPPLRDCVLQQIVRWTDTELILVRQPSVTRQDLLVPPAWLYRMP